MSICYVMLHINCLSCFHNIFVQAAQKYSTLYPIKCNASHVIYRLVQKSCHNAICITGGPRRWMCDFCTTCTCVHYKFLPLICLLYTKFGPFIPSWRMNISSYEWVYGTVLQDCFGLQFVPDVKQHCRSNHLSLKTILVWTMLLNTHNH